MSSTHLIVSKNGSPYDLLKHKLVLLVSHLMVNLSESQPRQQTVQHFVASSLKHLCEFTSGALLQPIQNIKQARMDARLETVQFDLLALDLDVPMQGAEVGS